MRGPDGAPGYGRRGEAGQAQLQGWASCEREEPDSPPHNGVCSSTAPWGPPWASRPCGPEEQARAGGAAISKHELLLVP